jgi:hypothetical protein
MAAMLHASTATAFFSTSTSATQHQQQQHSFLHKNMVSTEQPSSSMDATNNSNNCNYQPDSLQSFDPEMAALIANEDHRQRSGLELIASENFVSQSVRQVLGSCLTNKYSEGQGGY